MLFLNSIHKKIHYFGFLNLTQRSLILLISFKWLEFLKKAVLFFTIELPYLYPIPILNSKNSRFNVIDLESNALPKNLPKTLNKTIGIHLHLYYLDLANDILERLQNLHYPFDLYVSISKTKTISNLQSQLRKKLPMVKKITIREVPNLGKDLGPLIASFGEELSHYDIVGHFHTKKSTHLSEGIHWYHYILDLLLGPQEAKAMHINQLVYLVSQKNSLAYPDQYLKMTNSEDGWESNKSFLKSMLKQYTNIRLKNYPMVEFTQGSMFWSHSTGIKKFLTLPITYQSFDRKNKKNNALEHLLERLILIYASQTRAKLYKIKNKSTFSILVQTDQRLQVSDILPRLNHLKSLHIEGEVLIITNKPVPFKIKTFRINPWITAKIISHRSPSRAVKMNHLLSGARGQIIILHADDFAMNASAIKSHLDFHTKDREIKSICFGMAFIKNKTIYNAWLEKKGFNFGIPFKKNASYDKKKFDFFYSANTSLKYEAFKTIGIFNESCEFDCVEDWLMWKDLKKNGYQFFHVPPCDVEHIHQVSIRDRFLGLIQLGWNLAHLNLASKKLDKNLDQKIRLLHQELVNASKKLTRPNELFSLIEQIAPLLGGTLYKEKTELNDMYSVKKILNHIFLKRNLSIPNFDAIEISIRKSSPINLFKLYSKEGLDDLKNDLKKLIS